MFAKYPRLFCQFPKRESQMWTRGGSIHPFKAAVGGFGGNWAEASRQRRRGSVQREPRQEGGVLPLKVDFLSTGLPELLFARPKVKSSIYRYI